MLSEQTYPLNAPTTREQLKGTLCAQSGAPLPSDMNQCSFSGLKIARSHAVRLIGWYCGETSQYFDVRIVHERFVNAACGAWSYEAFDFDKATQDPTMCVQVMLVDGSEHEWSFCTDTDTIWWRGTRHTRESLRRVLCERKNRAVAMRLRYWFTP